MTFNDNVSEYGNHREEEKYLMLSITGKALCGVGLAILIILALIGNLLTIIAYIRDKRFHTIYDFYIFHLAVTDILIGTISMPLYAVYTLSNLTWPFGRTFCKVYELVDFTLCFQSILVMLLLSLDRLLLFAYGPLYTEKETMRKARIKIGISWLISCLIYGPEIIMWDYLTGTSVVVANECDVEFYNNYKYITITAIIEFVLPFFVLTSMNTMIYCKIRHRTRVPINNLARPITSTFSDSPETGLSTVNEKPSTLDVPTASGARSTPVTPEQNSRQQSRKDRDVKAARFLTVLVIAFLICWVPYTTTTVIISFCKQCVNVNLYEFFQWLLWAKSSINPFLYAFNSVRYKQNFVKLLYCATRRGIRVGPDNSRMHNMPYTVG